MWVWQFGKWEKMAEEGDAGHGNVRLRHVCNIMGDIKGKLVSSIKESMK
jgi:hypothetical protein